MTNNDLAVIPHPSLLRLRELVNEARVQFDVAPTAFATMAGLSPSTINRKMNHTDASIIKQTTLDKLEEALANLRAGAGQKSGEQIIMDINKTNDDIARGFEELVELLVSTKVVQDEQLPDHLKRALQRRRYLLALLGKSTV